MTPTMNKVDLLDCLQGHHTFDDSSEFCHVCGVQQDKASVPRPRIWDAVADEWEMACPCCAAGEFLDVQAKVFVRLCEDGTDIDASGNHDHEWDADSICQCSSCGWSGLVEDTQKFYGTTPRRAKE